MDKKTKLILALQQIKNISLLVEDNKWKNFLYSHLISIETELKRQLLCINNQT
jgi:hypothetical protein